ncbi:MAG: excinuclease ABC subunit UvrC, partial [Deltaproteobacteria bacterium]
PCILHQIHRCPAPCVLDLPREEYARSVDDAVDFLEGREGDLLPRLQARMRESAEAMRFEEAARLRDQLRAVERSLETQRVMMEDRADRDVVGIHREGPDLVIQVLSMRAGKLVDSQAHPFSGQEFPGDELLSSFLSLHYERVEPPDEILLPIEPSNAEAVADVLSERRGRKVRFLLPQRGAKVDLLDVAQRNAEQAFRGWREEGVRRTDALAALARTLSLHREPRWMECFDISTFQGSMAVGSGVSMREGEPDRAGYRRYRVKGVVGQDDFAMLHEVLTRRLRRALAEGSMPDLLVIDGGKGQLAAALAAARDLGVATRPDPGNPGVPFVQMVGLAKARNLDAAALSTTRVVSRRSARSASLADAAERAGRGFVSEAARTPERVFLPGRKDPVILRQSSAEMYLLVRLRDEAHRFAIEFHRKLRRARTLRSGLDEIPGIGEQRRRALLRHFGSLRRVREATPEELQAVEGVGPVQARAIQQFFEPEGGTRLIAGEGERMDGPPGGEHDAAR